MELYSRVKIKATGKTGTILEKGSPFGELLYLILRRGARIFDSTVRGRAAT